MARARHVDGLRRMLVGGGLTAAALVPAQADALTAGVDGDRVVLDSIGLERNTIQIEFLSTKVLDIRELDPNGPTLFGLNIRCDRFASNPRHVRCDRFDGLTRVVGDLGPGDDTLTVIDLPHPVDIDGGLGSDTLTGGTGTTA